MTSKVAKAIKVCPSGCFHDETLLKDTKRCSMCGNIKPLDAFSISKKRNDGRQSYCKMCRKLHHEKNRTRDNELSRLRHKTNVIDDHARNKAYYESNKDAILARCAEYRKSLDPEMVAAYRRKWRENNGQYIKAWLKDYRECYRYILWARQTLRSHKNRGFQINVSSERVAEMAMNTPYCTFCGESLYWGAFPQKTRENSPSLDRMFNGDELCEDNINIICNKCNATKGNRTIEEFIAYCKTIADRYSIEAEKPRSVVVFEEEA